MSKKLIPVFILIILVVGAGAFYGGMKYGQSSKQINVRGDFARMANGQRPDGAQFGQGAARGNGGGMVNGEVLSLDDKSITVKLRDGGSKIVLFSGSTQIMKSANGVIGDVKSGETIVVTGTTNADGSVTAQNIQLRPNIPAPVAPTIPVPAVK